MIGVTECQSQKNASIDVIIEMPPTIATTPSSHSSLALSKHQSFNANKQHIFIDISQEPEHELKQTTCTDMLVFATHTATSSARFYLEKLSLTAHTAARSTRAFLEHLSLALDEPYQKYNKAKAVRDPFITIDQNHAEISLHTPTPAHEIRIESLFAPKPSSSDIAISTSVNRSRQPNTDNKLIRRRSHSPPSPAT